MYSQHTHYRQQANIAGLFVELHPEFEHWYSEWRIIRDCIEGESAIKRQNTEYLAKISSDQTTPEYSRYLDNAVYFNMVDRTLNGLLGSTFRREPVIRGLPDKLVKSAKRITKDSQSFSILTKTLVREIGRASGRERVCQYGYISGVAGS